MININKRTMYVLATALSIVALLILVWLSLGGGMIGVDGDPANFMYLAIIMVGLFGSLLVRFHSFGMAITLAAMGLTQTVITCITLVSGLGLPWSAPLGILLNGYLS